MATNNFNEQSPSNDYDLYSTGVLSPLPGSPTVDASGHLVIPPEGSETYFPPPANPSRMDPDPNNTGPTTDFWTAFPITIDVNGDLFYYGENTGINVRGPAGSSGVRFDDLTAAQKEELRGPAGQNGINGVNGADGRDGVDGLSAYELWLQEEGYSPEQHPIEEFFQWLANIGNILIREGTGTDSLILNDKNGYYNTADGIASLAGGRNSQALGNYSISLGQGALASKTGQIALGNYNENKTNSIFEVGNGSDILRHNVFEIDNSGNMVAAGTIEDGNGNRLDNKVDKVAGKGLSTYDFNSTYKDFIDNYTVDIALSSSSPNPISNSAVTAAINNIITASGKPAINQNSTDNDLNFGFINDTTQPVLNTLYWTNGLKWNPYTRVIKNNNIDTSTYTDIVSFGTTGLTASANEQIILGKYNDANANNYLEIGAGASGAEANILELSKTGDLTAAGDITDGAGNVLSDKQDLLEYDTAPTQYSNKLIKSGDWYEYLLDIGINPVTGINIPEIAQLQSAVTALTARVTALEAAVTAIGNPREIPDDLFPSNIYTYGINNDKFYIQKIRPVDPEPEEEEGE